MELNNIQLLIVSAGCSRFGIDVDQIAYMANFNAGDTAISFEHLLGIDPMADCKYPKMLVIKQKMEMPILINEPDEVAAVSISDIHSLPDVLALSAGTKGVWGLLPQQQGLIILIDFYKNQLLKQLTHPQS